MTAEVLGRGSVVSPQRLRQIVRSQVIQRREFAVDERERISIAAFIDAFDALTSPFDEHGDIVHVTASAIVIGRRGVVLHRHKRLGLWLQPGGHVDPGESPWDAAQREAVEETGLDVGEVIGRNAVDLDDGGIVEVPEVIHVDVHPGPRGHVHLDLRYLFHAVDAAPDPGVGESRDVAWFDWADALELADGGLVGVLGYLAPGR